MRRMLTVQDWAAIAKGLQEGCSLRRTADRIVWIGVRGISRGIRRDGGKCGYQPVTADVKAQKRRTLTKDPQDRCRIGSSKARAQVGPEAFQDTPPNRRGDSGQRLVMAVLNRARAPRAPKERLCPTRPSKPGFYALVTRRTGPSRDHAALEAHQTQVA